MNSVFLNYDTSYFDLLNTDALLPTYGSNKLIKSLDGKLVESDVSLDSAPFEEQFYTNKTTLGLGERRAFNPDFRDVQIGYWLNGTIGYPDMNCDIYPTTKFHNGLKFSQNASKYNDSDLWVNNSGVLNYRDRGVVSVGNSVVPVVGNIPVFGSATYGAIEDSGYGISSGVLVVPLEVNLSDPGVSVGVDFEYQKIGKCVNLTLRKKLFQGGALGDPNGFQTQDVAGLLPMALRPVYEVSCPIMIYAENGGNAELINQVGLLRIGAIVNDVLNSGNVEIYKSPDGNAAFSDASGDFDGWSSTTITYFTLLNH